MSFTAANYGFWEFWAPYDPDSGNYGYQKVTFDGINKLIYVDPEAEYVSVREDIYSNWKEWVQVRDHAKFEPAMRVTGGDPIDASLSTGDIYFLINGWQIVVDHNITFDGVIYSDDYDIPFIREDGTNIVINKVSNLVQSLAPDTTIQQALNYGGKVIVDFTELDSAGVYPWGTWTQPVNNFDHAKQIAEAYGLDEIIVRRGNGAITGNMSNYSIASVNNNNRVILAPSADVTGTTFTNLSIEGYCSNNQIQLVNCRVFDIRDFTGTMTDCSLHGEIRPANQATVSLYNCHSGIAGTNSPIINCNLIFTDLSLAIRRYSGGIQFQNVNAAGFAATVEVVAGKIHLDNTCTQGYMSVRGTALLNDSSNGLTIDQSALVQNLIDVSVSDDFANIASTINSIDANVVSANSTLSNVESIVIQNNTELGNLEVDISSVSTDLSTLSGDVLNVQNTIDAVSVDLANTSNTVNTIAGDVNNIETIVTGTAANVVNIENIVQSNGGLTPTQATMLLEMYELLGLDPTKPLVVTETSRTAGTIDQTIDTNNTRTIVTRNP